VPLTIENETLKAPILVELPPLNRTRGGG
jgi:hypothetical protein